MPGLIIFKRRWTVGSDDLVVPAVILLSIHAAWIIVLGLVLLMIDANQAQCMMHLKQHALGYLIILIGCVIVEAFISFISMRGTIMDPKPRHSIKYLLYIRIGILMIEIIWLAIGVYWHYKYYSGCPSGFARDAIVGITVCNWSIVISVLVTVWCTFDSAGRSWVKMKSFQESLKEGQSKFQYRRSGNNHRNWRHSYSDIKTVREYQDSWNRRCRFLFCCIGQPDRNQNSFTEIAKLLSEFFRDLDVVPSDVIAGLILLRKQQKLESEMTIKLKKNSTFQYLSGVAITQETKFLDVNHPQVVSDIETLIHYMHYAVAVYGWPIFMMMNSGTGCLKLCPYLSCMNNPCKHSTPTSNTTIIDDDNCCQCNYSALQNICKDHDYVMIYATYHVAIAEPPFFVALDYGKRSVVISVRGTLSLQDLITDLNAEGEVLPTNPIREEWLAHKGMVQAAVYIKDKLRQENILSNAFNHDVERGSQNFKLVLAGHSLGAGTAAILSILLKEDYPDLICYAFAPPGGLLSLPALEYTKNFIVSVVLGKDVVPRLGLHQMELLRFDLIKSIKQSNDPKWKIIGGGICCCRSKVNEIDETDLCDGNRELNINPTDDSVSLTVHPPLYPPGKIIHIVRNHPKKSEKKYETRWRRVVCKNEPIFQALWVDNKNFDQILISPVMIQDHMPDKMLQALETLLINTGPAKPQRRVISIEKHNNNDTSPLLYTSTSRAPQMTFGHDNVDNQRNPTNNQILIETSFIGSPKNYTKFPSHYERPSTLTMSNNVKVDFLRDSDWFGHAPLASPETWSVSSVSTISETHRPGGLVYGLIEPIPTLSGLLPSQTHNNNKEDSNHMNIPFTSNEIQSNSSSIDEHEHCHTLDQKDSPHRHDKRDTNRLSIEEAHSSRTVSCSPDDNCDDHVHVAIDVHDNQHLKPNLSNLHQCCSDTDLTNNWNEPMGLRRSNEEMRLNNLDDVLDEIQPVFGDGNVANTLNNGSREDKATNSQRSQHNLEVLLNKLMTIESPSSEGQLRLEHFEDMSPNVLKKEYL